VQKRKPQHGRGILRNSGGLLTDFSRANAAVDRGRATLFFFFTCT
jgi:hypothetical protein